MRRFMAGAAVAALAFGFAPRAQALTTAFFNFDPPGIAQAPSEFLEIGPMQTITIPGVGTISGGVVLGIETNLPALSFGTTPNVYGTALNTYIASPTVLPDQMTITVNPSFELKEISFPLFNGVTDTESYTVDAFNGTTNIGEQVLSNLPSNNLEGHGVIDLHTTQDITSVVITPGSLNPWDYSIDSIAFNEPVSQAITPGGTPITQPPPSGVPLPASAWMSLALLGGLGLMGAMKGRVRYT